MSACATFESLLLEQAADALAGAEAARLEAHLSVCAGCRAEAAALAEALDLARLPPPDQAEWRALDGLSTELMRRSRSATRRRAWPVRVAAAVAVAAAAAAFLLAPAFSRRAPRVEAPAAETAWESPDPDTLWEAASVAGDESDSDADPVLEASAGWADLASDDR
jgi:Putative zinc-finger